MPHLDALVAASGGCVLPVVDDSHLADLVRVLSAIVVRLHLAIRHLINAPHGLGGSSPGGVFDAIRSLSDRVPYSFRVDVSGPPPAFPKRLMAGSGSRDQRCGCSSMTEENKPRTRQNKKFISIASNKLRHEILPKNAIAIGDIQGRSAC